MRQNENRRSQEEPQPARRGNGQSGWSAPDRGNEPQDDRGFMERAGDEVRSWFGDEEAARRRQIDDQRPLEFGPRRGFPGVGMMGMMDTDVSWQYRQYAGPNPPPEYGYGPMVDPAYSGYPGYDPNYPPPPGMGGMYGQGYSPPYPAMGPGYQRSRNYPQAQFGGNVYYGAGRPSGYEQSYGQDNPYAPGMFRRGGPGYHGPSIYGGNPSFAPYGMTPQHGAAPGVPERGRYYGRGPRGYQRPDERITEEINELLFRHPDIDASEVEVAVRSGEVTLTGNVEDRATKRMIEDLVEDLVGVREVHNQLRVGRHPVASAAGTQSHAEGSTSGPAAPEKGRGKSNS